MKISVVMANYNYGKYICRALTSLMNQTFKDFEIIVVDDGSTDYSLQVLEPYRSDIKLIAHNHQGQAVACNHGFNQSTGQFIVRVDADDYVNKDFLLIESMFLEDNKEYDAVSCDYYIIGENGNRLGRYYAEKNPIACGMMFRRESLFEAGLYADVKIWEEVEFMKRFLKNHKVYHLPLPLYRYLKHKGSVTNK